MCTACRQAGVDGMCRGCVERLSASRWVAQVPALGIVMAIHGALMSLLGAVYVVYGFVLAYVLQDLPKTGDGPKDAVSDMMPGLLAGGMAGVALVHVVPGLVQAFAGLRVYRFRSRTLAIVALAAGLVSVVGCYCAPTTVALLVWGMIVLFDGAVQTRFRHAET